MKKVIASLVLAVALSGCAATTALKAVTSLAGGGTGTDITAQVGAENTKNGVGLSNKTETTATTTALSGDVKGNATVTQSTSSKTAQTSARDVTADTVKVNTTNVSTYQVLGLVGMCLSVMALLVIYILHRYTTAKAEETTS